MSTLADTFLQDLDDLGDSDEENNKQSGIKELSNGGTDAMHNEKQTLENLKINDALKSLERKDISSIAKILSSDRYKIHLEKISSNSERHPNFDSVGPLGRDPEYNLIIKTNEIIADIDDELLKVHRYIVDSYSPKFPELESIVTDPLDYVRTVQLIKEETDMTKLPLDTILPQAAVMVVSVTASTTPGRSLTEEELDRTMKGCAAFIDLTEAKAILLKYVESRMNLVAPNMCILIGSRIAAQLMGLAGGLNALSKIPTCNLQTMGQEKRNMAGFSTTATGSAHMGLIFYSELVQSAPPYLRRKFLKVVAAKVTLALRADLHGSDLNANYALRLKEELKAKVEKWQEPDKAKIKRALPKPDEAPKSRRGGKRVRKFKEKFTLTDVQKEQNKMGFASESHEYGDSAMGRDFGMLGKANGRVRAPPQKKQQQLGISKKLKMAGLSSGTTNGLSSSIVFTPVQGIELVNPNAEREAKVKAANAKWFDQSSGFLSAKPK